MSQEEVSTDFASGWALGVLQLRVRKQICSSFGSEATSSGAYATACPTKDVARYTVLVLTMQALVKRQLLVKTRAWGSTLAELCSPVLLICMLVVAYHLVHPDHHHARVRANACAVQ